ncbi:hypothetical protein AB6806_26745 [Bosea sp. RCC_152_1]|uniref:hypothetical protein n=1 Tax=Bosea sp. RCC_152_1 TaxID=3239228 RepID=UPI003525DAEE
MTILSIEEQDRLIQRDFPQFTLVHDSGLFAIWRGALCPIQKPYEIEIAYCPFDTFDEFTILNGDITVRLISPELVVFHPVKGGLVHHVYADPEQPARSPLCLYDPRTQEWSPARAMAETIIPWAMEWLFFYEAWLLTGEWHGGGRGHPSLERSRPCPTNAPPCPALPAHSGNAAFHRLGLRTGTSASFRMMAAASEGSFPPRSWRAWRRLSPVGSPSRIAST